MASAHLKQSKDGSRRFYEIHARNGKTQYTERWYVPDGWSKKTIDRELNKVKADFERRVKAGEVQTRRQQEERAMQEAEEAARIKTLKQYGEAVYMPTVKIVCSENTRDSYQRQLDLHIYPALGHFKLPEITTAQINAFLLGQQEKGLSWASCTKQYNILQRIFKRAYYEDLIEKNPMEKVIKPQANKDEVKKTIEAFTREEVAYIVDCLHQEPLQWQAIVSLYIHTGARRGEIMGLKWEDIDREKGAIHIRRTLCYTVSRGIYTNTPKNGKSRDVYPPAFIFDLLAELKQTQQDNKKVVQLSTLHGFVFQQEGIDAPMHPQSPTRYFDKFGRRYRIKDFHPHKLRHTFASVAITQGVDVASVSETLGHTDKATTLRMYTHADEESKRRASYVFQQAIETAHQG